MKRTIRNTAAVLLCAAISVCALWFANRVLMVKSTEGITTMQDFYAQERDTVDVLLLGSSHCGINLDTATLWSEYGMASYALWGGMQPFWNTYHFLVEALKTQTPKAVVLEAFAATFEFDDEFDESKQITNTAGMRLSRNKWEAVKVSAPKEKWLDVFFGLPQYHERFSELVRDDYMHFPWTDGLINDKGSLPRYGTGNVTLKDVSDIEEVAQIHGKEEAYLRKIIELCQLKGIPILLFKTPMKGAWQREQQSVYNRVAQIAQEYGVPFCNLNLMWQELGFSGADFDVDNSHLNIEGARKSTLRLGQELQKLCEIPDRRGEARYASWEENARRIQYPNLYDIPTAQNLIRELKNRDWALFFATTGRADEDAAELLKPLGVPDFLQEGKQAWLLTSTQQGEWIEGTQNDALLEAGMDGLHVSAEIGEYYTWVGANAFELSDLHGSDILLAVFDVNTKKCADIIRLKSDAGWAPEHLGHE